MRQSLKISISFLLSLIIAFVFVLLGASGLFKVIEANFYIPNIREHYNKLLKGIVSEIDTSMKENIDRFSAILENSFISSAFLSDQRKNPEDIKEREKTFSDLKERFPDFLYVRFIDPGGKKIHFSTLQSDLKSSNSNQRVYKNYDQVEDDIKAQNILRKEDDQPLITLVGKTNILIYSFPILDSYNVFKGTALFYISKDTITRKLLLSPEFDIIKDNILIQDKGILFNFSGELTSLIQLEILDIWEQNRGNTQFSSTILATIENTSITLTLLTLFTPNFGNVSLLISNNLFEIPYFYKIIMLILLFFTLFILIFIIFNVKQDPLIVISRRIKYLQIQFLKEFVDAQEEIDWKKWHKHLLVHGSRLKNEIKKDVGKIKKEKENEVDELINKSWNNIVSIIGRKAEHKIPVSFDVQKIEEIIKRALKSGNIVIPVQQADPGTLNKSIHKDKADVIKKSHQSETRDEEEISELDSIEEVHEIEEVKDGIEATEHDEVKTAEAVEELEEAEEILEVEELGSIESAEEVEELDEAEEILEVEELGDAESVEEIEELGEVEDLAESKELDDIASAEEVEELGEVEEFVETEKLDNIENVDEIEELDAAEDGFDTGQLEEIEGIEEIEELGKVEEVLEIGELDEIESIHENEKATEIDIHEKEAVSSRDKERTHGKAHDKNTSDAITKTGGEVISSSLPPEPFEQLEELELAANPDEYTYYERGGKYYLLRKELIKKRGKNGDGKQEQSDSIILYEPLKKTKEDTYNIKNSEAKEELTYNSEQDEYYNLINQNQIKVFNLDEVFEIMKKTKENIVMENGVFTISEDIMNAELKPRDHKLKELVDSVKDGIDYEGSEENFFFKGNTVVLEKEKKEVDFTHGIGIDFDNYMSYLENSDDLAIMKSLVEFSKDSNAYIVGIFVYKDDEYIIDVSVGLQEKTKKLFTFSKESIYSTEIFSAKRVCIIYTPLRNLQFLNEKLSDFDKKYISSVLFLPGKFKQENAYFIFGFSNKIKGSIRDVFRNLNLRFVS